MFSILQTAFRGPAQARAQHRQLLKGYAGISGGLSALSTMTTQPRDDATSPIFLFSAGWRSGSTLLQRLVMSDKQVLIWGEPYDECGPVQAMAQTMKPSAPIGRPATIFTTARRQGSSPAARSPISSQRPTPCGRPTGSISIPCSMPPPLGRAPPAGASWEYFRTSSCPLPEMAVPQRPLQYSFTTTTGAAPLPHWYDLFSQIPLRPPPSAPTGVG